MENSSLPSSNKETLEELPSNHMKHAESPAEDCQRSNSFSSDPINLWGGMLTKNLGSVGVNMRGRLAFFFSHFFEK
jgi:hypothetical protein